MPDDRRGCTPTWGRRRRRRSPCAGWTSPTTSWARSRSRTSRSAWSRAGFPTSGSRSSSTRCSSRSPTTASRRPSSRRGSPTSARPRRSRARSPRGVLGGGSVFLGVAEDAARLPRRDARAGSTPYPDDASAAAHRGRRGAPCAARAGPSHSRASAIRCTRRPTRACPAHVRAGARARPPRPAPAAAARSSPRSPRSRAAGGSRSTAPASRALALADLGFDWRIIRGFALLARDRGSARPPRGGDARRRWRCRSGRWSRPDRSSAEPGA